MKCRIFAKAWVLVALSVWFHSSSAQQSCQVTRKDFVNGGVAPAAMQIEGTSPCQFKFNFGGQQPPDNWELIELPKSGKVSFGPDFAEYVPNAGFTGEDKFVVALYGKAPQCTAPGARCNRNGRFEISVTVKPKS